MNRVLVPLIAAFVAGAAWGQFLCEPVPVGPAPPDGIPEYQVDEEAATTPVTIDLMLLYSPKAIEYRLHGLLNRTIDGVNEIYAESGTGITFRVAGTYVMREDTRAAELAARIESSTNEDYLDYDLLGAVSEDDGVDATRREVGADIVLTWTATNNSLNYGGIAYTPQSRSYFFRDAGFAAVHLNEVDVITVAHELGHNLGLMHHPEAPGRETSFPYLSYGQGYLGPSTPLGNRYMTVMGTFADVHEFRYQVDRLSRNGSHNWRGYNIRIGTQNHRAADATTVTAPWVAGYEAGAVTGSPPAAPTNLTGEALDATTVRLSWVDRSDNETGFEIHYRRDGGEWGQLNENAPADWTWMEVVWESPPSTKRWHFRLRAFNDYGGAYSNITTVTLPDPDAEPPPPPPDDCPSDRACIDGGRFEVFVWYWNKGGWNRAQRLTTADLGQYGAVFYFFDRTNPELLIKVLNGCGINRHWWVYGSAGTDLNYQVKVRDRGGRTVTYRRDAALPLITDSTAIPCNL